MGSSNFFTRMSKVKKYTTTSRAETITLGQKYAKHLKAGDIIYLIGELGSGKTTFTKGICKALEIKEIVTSPSFVIVSEYHGKIPVCHIDLYRLNQSDITTLGLEEYYINNGITIIEWADRLPHFLKYKNSGIYIFFNIKEKNLREISIEDFRH